MEGLDNVHEQGTTNYSSKYEELPVGLFGGHERNMGHGESDLLTGELDLFKLDGLSDI